VKENGKAAATHSVLSNIGLNLFWESKKKEVLRVFMKVYLTESTVAHQHTDYTVQCYNVMESTAITAE